MSSEAVEVPSDNILIDYRSELNYDAPSLTPQQKRRILQAIYGAESNKSQLVINSAESGSFTKPGFWILGKFMPTYLYQFSLIMLFI